MIAIEFDIKDFERKAQQLHAAVDQVPYALSRAMNDAAFATRQRLIDQTWPQHVTVRNPNFLKAALHVEPSTKTNLEVHIVDQLKRGHLEKHAHGGTKQARSTNLAIPIAANVPRESGGRVRRDYRAAALVAATPKRALRITQSGIFIGRHGKLHLMYKLQPTAQIKQDVPFVQDFKQFFCEEVEQAFPVRLDEAMATRR